MPSDREGWRGITSRANAVRDKLTAGTNALLMQISLINLDFSVGRLGPADLREMNARLRLVLLRAAYVYLFCTPAMHFNVLDRGLISFQNLVNETNIADEEEEKKVESLSHSDATPGTAPRFQAMMRDIREREIRHGHNFDTLIPILASSSADLRSACENGLICVMDWFQQCNTRRWAAYFSKPNDGLVKERHDKLVDQLNELQATLEEFRSVHRSKLVQPYERFFDPQTKRLLRNPDEKEMFASRCVLECFVTIKSLWLNLLIRSLFTCFVFLDTLDAFAEHLLQVLKMVVDIDIQRPSPKIWFPGRLSKVKDDIIDAEFQDSAGPYAMGTTTDPTSFDSDSTTEDGDEEDEEELSEPASTP